jgi:hypothetical protein
MIALVQPRITAISQIASSARIAFERNSTSPIESIAREQRASFGFIRLEPVSMCWP